MARELAEPRQPLAMQPFEVEAQVKSGSDTWERAQQSGRCGIFPCEPCKWCPRPILACLPTQWTRYQGWVHLLLLAGSIACTGLLVDCVVQLQERLSSNAHAEESRYEKGWAYLRHAVVLIFVLPCLCYFVRTVGQFDEDLRNKKLEAESARQKLKAAYLDTLGEMEGILCHATETNAGFAERTFETKRRDFLRFLERTQTVYESTTKDAETKATAQQFFVQMKRFCNLWFKTFAECSIDPAGDPKLVVSPAELERCQTIVEVCALCKERLRIREVKFISNQKQLDSNEIAESRKILHSKPQVNILRASWLRCGCFGCKLCNGLFSQEYPKHVEFGCFRVDLLSKEHVMLMVGWTLGLALLALEIWLPHTQKRILALIAMNELCLGMTLIKFEDLDILQQIETEIRQTEEDREVVRKKHATMQEFWTSAQQNIDVWLHRTVPQLDLFSEVHSHIEDMSGRQALQGLTGANQMFQALDDKLGPMEAWMTGGLFTTDEKKRFEVAVVELTTQPDLANILDKSGEITTTLQEINETCYSRSFAQCRISERNREALEKAIAA